jgi:hypothetical protein
MEGMDRKEGNRSDAAPRPARRGDPWLVRLQAARRAVVALRAQELPPLSGDWLTALQIGAQEVERFRAVLLEHRTDLSPRDPDPDEAVARVIAVLMECDAGCAHGRSDDPPEAYRLPFHLPLGHRQIFCRPCFALAWVDPGRRPPPRIPDDRCDWCEAPTEIFHEEVMQSPTLLIFSNACAPCHHAVMRQRQGGAVNQLAKEPGG